MVNQPEIAARLDRAWAKPSPGRAGRIGPDLRGSRRNLHRRNGAWTRRDSASVTPHRTGSALVMSRRTAFARCNGTARPAGRLLAAGPSARRGTAPRRSGALQQSRWRTSWPSSPSGETSVDAGPDPARRQRHLGIAARGLTHAPLALVVAPLVVVGQPEERRGQPHDQGAEQDHDDQHHRRVELDPLQVRDRRRVARCQVLIPRADPQGREPQSDQGTSGDDRAG